jgi:hypothetical protein
MMIAVADFFGSVATGFFRSCEKHANHEQSFALMSAWMAR